ncbi:hypothetical protein J8F10_13670 [Gemmata sp. G18]|uniref:Uncharacterized protein n=1 Tax=Gemmata palustris TaxID=2822762 RepID=A0ABS5BRH7_9BACT|nr:hypothetical protein [Gemmata palustris]MBP3956334.1 hypothetical protein [Gemmata palustris]
MSPLDNNPFADAVLDAFRSASAPGADPYRGFFVAKLTAKADVAGVWNYNWVEQTFGPGTGLPTDANPARSGGIVSGAPISPALELNNLEVDLAGDVFVFMRQKGIVNGQVYYEFVARGTRTTTTTTAAPCTGSCLWTYAAATKTWTRTSTSCQTGCKCLAPTFCPPADATTQTACGHFNSDQTPTYCGGSTTTSGACTTTTNSACVTGCDWYCHPARGWQLTANGCSSACPCSALATPCGDGNRCGTAHTGCVSTPAYCSGGCRWVWTGTAWEQVSHSCSSNGVSNCFCDAPTGAGTVCAQETQTGCYVHGPNGGADPCAPPTTTTAGPGCSGTCLWLTSNGTQFDTIYRFCPGCDCAAPTAVPQSPSAVTETPCVPFVTTTTTTAPPTTTTTTAGACGSCTYQCNSSGTGFNYYSSICGASCGCPDIAPVGNCVPGSFRAVACQTGATTAGPTTTTTTTTTTGGGTTTTGGGTTTTTTGGGGGTTTTTTTTGGGGGTTTGGGPSYFCQTCENGTPYFCSGVIVCTVVGAHYTMIDCVANCQTIPTTSITTASPP